LSKEFTWLNRRLPTARERPFISEDYALDIFLDTPRCSGGQKGAKAVPISENLVRLGHCGTRISAVGHHNQ